jgi:16S rRNA (cytosine967-C5)-methyltransferase
MVKAGGFVLYSVCSLQPEEGAGVAATVTDKAPRIPITADAIGGMAELITPAGELRTLPCHLAQQGGMDGFYGVLLRR